MKNLQRNSRGVTLLELLVVVAIIGILTMLTLPNIPAIIAGHRLRTANNDLIAKLRSVRALAITKGRTLELVMDTGEHSFQVWKQEYKEYNLLDEFQNEDLQTVLTATDYTADDEAPFILFEETRELLHITPLWDRSTGQPIYDVPINYDIMKSGKDHRNGIASMTMTLSDETTDTDTIVFDPSGTIKNNVIITLNGPPKYQGQYKVYVFKAGQIRGKT